MTGNIELCMRHCTLCPRECGADRMAGRTGYCRVPARITAARAALHMWEEPCISGKKGSGAVFFSGCSLGCIYCQNYRISDGSLGRGISPERLCEIFLRLQNEDGAANINLVTAGQYIPQVVSALERARSAGLVIPVVYNSSGYEKAQTIKMLEGLVDIYLPDFKYMDSALAAAFSHAPDYPERAMEALLEMTRQVPSCSFDSDGYMTSGVIVRHLILPGHVRNSKSVLSYLHETYGDSIYISIMNQYTPVRNFSEYPELNRKVTKREYERVLDYACSLGIRNAFIQEGETASESFIPPFDCEGI